jgi:hypothetical protein
VPLACLDCRKPGVDSCTDGTPHDLRADFILVLRSVRPKDLATAIRPALVARSRVDPAFRIPNFSNWPPSKQPFNPKRNLDPKSANPRSGGALLPDPIWLADRGKSNDDMNIVPPPWLHLGAGGRGRSRTRLAVCWPSRARRRGGRKWTRPRLTAARFCSGQPWRRGGAQSARSFSCSTQCVQEGPTYKSTMWWWEELRASPGGGRNEAGICN